MIRVTIWNENFHERMAEFDEKFRPYQEKVLAVHPNGLHNTLADLVRELGDEVTVRTATLDMPDAGLPQEVLDDTDVLLWWGHMAHDRVPDEVVDRVQQAVLNGMGLIVLHSAHHSKVFKRLMGTTCDICWRDDTFERVFCVEPSHPIAQGLPRYFELDVEECYGERFDIPKPDDVVFMAWHDIGEVLRCGCTFTRGYGKIFYFQPGHETNRSYYNQNVRTIIKNAVKWAAPHCRRTVHGAPHIDVTLEELRLGKK